MDFISTLDSVNLIVHFKYQAPPQYNPKSKQSLVVWRVSFSLTGPKKIHIGRANTISTAWTCIPSSKVFKHIDFYLGLSIPGRNILHDPTQTNLSDDKPNEWILTYHYGGFLLMHFFFYQISYFAVEIELLNRKTHVGEIKERTWHFNLLVLNQKWLPRKKCQSRADPAEN